MNLAIFLGLSFSSCSRSTFYMLGADYLLAEWQLQPQFSACSRKIFSDFNNYIKTKFISFLWFMNFLVLFD